MEEPKISIHVSGVLPKLVSQPETKILPPDAVMLHTDAMSGDETVTVLAGPLQVTTSDAVYYLVQFVEDRSIWLCYADDLTSRD